MPSAKLSSPEDDSGAEDGEDNVKAVSKRACDYCHRMKMRCINKENPPCNRCKQGGHACTFGGTRKSKATRVEDRLKVVESQMSTFQSSLTELLQLQRANAQPQSTSSRSQIDDLSFAVPDSSRLPPSQESVPEPAMFSLSTIEGQYRRGTGQYGQGSPGPSHGQGLPKAASQSSSNRQAYDTTRNGISALQLLQPPRHKRPYENGTQLSNSPYSSDEDDPDPVLASSAFPGPWRSMLSLAEAARLKADNQLSKDETVTLEEGILDGARAASASRTLSRTHPFDYGPSAEKKRRRSTLEDNTGLRGAMPVQRGSQNHAHKDPVELGLISEEHGRRLFESFMQNCHFYIPVFDPDQDTWASLRQRSPFAIAAILYIGMKCEEAGGAVSEMQGKLREHAEKIGMSTLFTPVARIEVVQALIVMAQWGDTIYRPGGHALRIATEMGLWRCLPYLVQTGMGRGKSQSEVSEERPLVVGARAWLTLYKTDAQMAFNSGRPIGISLESIQDARRLLEHPLTIPTDSRLVTFCELQTLRLPLHTPFILWPSTSNIPDLDQKLRDVNKEFAVWFSFWDNYYERKGYAADALLRVTLTTMLCGTDIYCNSLILNGVRSKRDVALLSEERQGFLLKAVKAAETLMNTAFRGEKGKQYLDRFRYANSNTHLNFAFVARFLIRMSSLVPEVVNLRQVGRDVEQCAKTLSNVPGFQHAQLLRDILLKARKKHVLPPPSRVPSPTRVNARLPLSSFTPTQLGSAQPQLPSPGPNTEGMFAGFSPNQGSEMSNGLGLPELDFGLAEQLFSEDQGGWASGGAGFGYNHDGELSHVTGAISQNFGFDPWYPFPPLDSDVVNNLNPIRTGAQEDYPLQGFLSPSSLSNSIDAARYDNSGEQQSDSGSRAPERNGTSPAVTGAPVGWW